MGKQIALKAARGPCKRGLGGGGSFEERGGGGARKEEKLCVGGCVCVCLGTHTVHVIYFRILMSL